MHPTPDKVRDRVLFKLIPVSLADEILKQTTKWATYIQLKEHLHSLKFLRAKGPAPMSCSNLEEESQESLPETLDEETFTNKDGDLLRSDKKGWKASCG